VRLVRSAPDASDLCRRVSERVDQAGSRAERVRVRVASGHILAAVEQMEESRRRLAEAKTIAGTDEQLLKPALVAEVELATRKGDFKRAWDRLEELHRIVRAKSDDQEKHRVALQGATARAALGDRPSALASLAEAEELLPDDGAGAVERARVRVLVDLFTRDFKSAIAHAEKAIEMGRELGLTYEVMVNLHNLGWALVYNEDLPRAYGAFQQSLSLCEEGSYERIANHNRMFLAYLDGLQGTADGQKLLAQGIAYAESKDFTWDVVGGRALLAKLLHRRGTPEEARAAYERAQALATMAGHTLIAEDCERALEALRERPSQASAE
jgi:tetratricopeptide (TPR) repeat protein